MTRIHTANDCDETCYCCVECYMATGESVCRKLCPHNECACGERIAPGHAACAECMAEDVPCGPVVVLDADDVACLDAEATLEDEHFDD